MNNIIKLAAIAAFTLSITACSGESEAPEADATTETRMDEVDVIDGTISDDMVDIDAQQETDAVEEGSEDASTDEGAEKKTEENTSEEAEE